MSLDGFITGPNVRPDNALGDGGERLHEWIFQGAEVPDAALGSVVDRLGSVNRGVFREVMSTGAVIAGRRTFEPAGGWGGDHHDGVPIYILSRHPAPEWTAGWPNVHYTEDLLAAVHEAKLAAGDRTVLVHGASIARRMLAAGLLDELAIHVVPILLGDGIRLFDDVDRRGLETIRVLSGEDGVTHLHYRVLR